LGDLHTHTLHSDGVLTTEQLLRKAVEAHLSVISITDHDNTDGARIAMSMKDEFPIEIISGIELSCYEMGKEYHILGYGFDLDNSDLLRHIEGYRVTRLRRAEEMHKKLKSLGVVINFDDILTIAGTAPVTRPHIAEAIRTAGYTENLKEAFSKFIGDGGPAYQGKPYYPVEEAIKLINKAGGVAVLAHPCNWVEQSKLYRMIESGLDGIEVFHPTHNETLQRYYASIVGQFWLLQTGGSDYHGNRDYDEANFGKITVSATDIESLKYRAGIR